ncbi:hypothetical protein POM88_015446 [Heracleum sosnowskyi]|uniref:Uncharacterized protein n=1 Tax=Heracleum sosnowskyi TaxID=360622 RepID=A0AAD8IM88_9APIA|nr:hypothetical protein POM88_015446 [Heracleum sosnowskyi]
MERNSSIQQELGNLWDFLNKLIKQIPEVMLLSVFLIIKRAKSDYTFDILKLLYYYAEEIQKTRLGSRIAIDFTMTEAGPDGVFSTGKGWTIISDQQKGLLQAINSLLPDVEQRNCSRLTYANFSK